MAISLVTSGSLVATSTTSTTVTGIQADDLVIFARASDATTYTNPTGFTSGSSSGGSSFPTTGWAYTFAESSSIEVTGLTGLPNNQAGAWIWMVFRGVDTTNPINTSNSFINTTSTNANVNPPAVTTTEDNCAIIIIGALDDDTGSTVVSVPSGYTYIVEQNAGEDPEESATIAAAYKIQAVAGTEDPENIVFSSTDLWTSFTIALQSTLDIISTGSISLDEVRTYLELATTASLQDCFTASLSISKEFDPLYSGSKDRLSNFKGYGITSPPTLPVVESYSTATTGGSASTNITFSSAPSGLTAGDLILILIANERDDNWLFQNETGYTRVTLASNANDVQLGIYYRIATGDANDGFPNLTIQHCTSNEFAVGWALRISGVDTSDPIPIFGTYQVGIGSSNQTVPSITTTTNGNLAIMFVGLDGSDVDPITITAGTGWTSGDFAQDDGGDQTLGVYGEWYTKEMLNSGATGTVSMSHGNDGWAGLQLAIKPA